MKMKYFVVLAIFSSIAWAFISCGSDSAEPSRKKSTNTITDGKSKEIGQKISQAAQKQLGKNLKNAINEGGYAYAVSFCRIKAETITDSVGTAYQVSVDRVSDQRRNPSNNASEEERNYIAQYKRAFRDMLDWSPKLISTSDTYTYYTPIITQPLCLNCHGDPEADITLETLERLQSEYPQDQAVGYKIGEVRGMWKIQWDKN